MTKVIVNFCSIQAYLEFFTSNKNVDCLKQILVHYPNVNYHIVDSKVSSTIVTELNVFDIFVCPEKKKHHSESNISSNYVYHAESRVIRVQRNSCMLGYSSYSLYVQLLWYRCTTPGGMKARASTVQ